MTTFRQFVTRNSLVIFFVLAYAISWSSVVPMNGSILPWGPAIAAVIVLGITSGRRVLSDLWRQMTRWRVGWVWYLVAPGLVLLYTLVAFLVARLLGATVTSTTGMSVSAASLTILQLLILGGQWEEPGWSGFALPRLQGRFTNRPVLASLVLGALRAGWHLPLVVYGHIPWYDFVFFGLGFQFLITWQYNRTRGSVLIVMLFHFTSNLMGAFLNSRFTGSDLTLFYGLFIAFAWLVVIAILFKDGMSLGLQPGMSAVPAANRLLEES